MMKSILRTISVLSTLAIVLMASSPAFVWAAPASKLGGSGWGTWGTATLDTAESFAIAKCSAADDLTVKVFLSDAVPFAGPSDQLDTLKAYLMVDGSGYLVGEAFFTLDSFGNGSVTVDGGLLTSGPHYVWLQIANVDGQINYDLPHTTSWPTSPTTWTISCP